MWKIISAEQNLLFIKIKLVDEIITTYVTDLTNLWLELLSKESAHLRFKVSFSYFLEPYFTMLV